MDLKTKLEAAERKLEEAKDGDFKSQALDAALAKLEATQAHLENRERLIKSAWAETTALRTKLEAAEREKKLIKQNAKEVGDDLLSRIAALEAENAKLIEELAKYIYRDMPYTERTGRKPAWVEHGNSDKQDEARKLARAALQKDDGE